jgi:hypothetical protein
MDFYTANGSFIGNCNYSNVVSDVRADDTSCNNGKEFVCNDNNKKKTTSDKHEVEQFKSTSNSKRVVEHMADGVPFDNYLEMKGSLGVTSKLIGNKLCIKEGQFIHCLDKTKMKQLLRSLHTDEISAYSTQSKENMRRDLENKIKDMYLSDVEYTENAYYNLIPAANKIDAKNYIAGKWIKDMEAMWAVEGSTVSSPPAGMRGTIAKANSAHNTDTEYRNEYARLFSELVSGIPWNIDTFPLDESSHRTKWADLQTELKHSNGASGTSSGSFSSVVFTSVHPVVINQTVTSTPTPTASA